MAKNRIKALVLLSSGTLVTLFLLYRNGALDNYFAAEDDPLQTSPNGGPFNALGTDTTIKPKLDTNFVLIPSSKSMVLIDKRTNKPVPDSLLKKKPVTDTAPRTRMIGGSKSVMIIDPKKYELPKPDSNKKKKKKDQ